VKNDEISTDPEAVKSDEIETTEEGAIGAE
jgi:hypothetical protein